MPKTYLFPLRKNKTTFKAKCNSACGRPTQEGHKFKASLSYIARSMWVMGLSSSRCPWYCRILHHPCRIAHKSTSSWRWSHKDTSMHLEDWQPKKWSWYRTITKENAAGVSKMSIVLTHLTLTGAMHCSKTNGLSKGISIRRRKGKRREIRGG